MKLFEVIFQF